MEAAPSLGWNAGFYNTYRLGEVMGHGSFGTVHRAVHRQTGTSYAVKVLQKSCSKRGMQLDAIKREVDTWQQAQRSKYVAKLEGLFEDEENAYIVQELCTGGTLRDHLHSQGCCSEREAANVMQGVLDLLVECHKRSICYGDLKPANIMFSGSLQQQRPLQVRAIDFGCSHSTQGRVLTQTCGSPLYMAPEVALQRYGVGVDVWSAGVMLYQMLTGRLPFWPKKTLEEVAKLPGYEILAAIRTYEVEFPRVLWADISPQAKDLVACMLDRNPATRITASQALQHPWLSSTLGFTPTPSGDSAVGANNVVEWVRGQRGSPLRPVPISPGKASGSCGALSPQKSSPLRAMLSGELPSCKLVADMNRAPMPVMVPAAE